MIERMFSSTWSHSVGYESSLWVCQEANSQVVHHLPGLPHIAAPYRPPGFKALAMKFLHQNKQCR